MGKRKTTFYLKVAVLAAVAATAVEAAGRGRTQKLFGGFEDQVKSESQALSKGAKDRNGKCKEKRD